MVTVIAIASQLNEYLNDYCSQRKQHGTNVWFIVRLVGAIRCMDPTAQAYAWLQSLSCSWMQQQQQQQQQQHQQQPTKVCARPNMHHAPNRTKNNEWIRVAAHVRVPEEFNSDVWKDDNHVMKLCSALDILLSNIDCTIQKRIQNPRRIVIEIYTEERFLMRDEQMMKDRYQNKNDLVDVQVHRGSTETLFDDIHNIATSDIFIPSSSYLSAFCGYLSQGIILISDTSRWQYFTTHSHLGCNIIATNENTTDSTGSNNYWSETETKIWQEFCHHWTEGGIQ
jgi:hypothetical protein